MSLKAKYQYTHFIYPFVVENKKYQSFIASLLKKEKTWNIKIDVQQSDEELYNFFLPYMRKFLFPTLFWSKDFVKQYKNMSIFQKSFTASKMSSVAFEYNLANIKTGSVSGKQYGAIHFDISNIRLICFEPGVCFLDIKTEIDEDEDTIEFNKILDFNHYFRNLTPRAISTITSKSLIKGKNIDSVESITAFIKSVISGFETTDLEKIYYDKMFTYSYVCVDGWEKESDFEKMQNDFYKFQYVINSKSSAVFNTNFSKLKEDSYSRWKYSMFGFSRESGVVFVSDKEKYNITRMPYNFEKTYFYMLLLAFYQRISLINFSQDLMRKDKTMIRKLKKELSRFTHMSWFSQITNSEHGMDIWESWQKAFELPSLFEEVQREYEEYYDFLRASGQERFNVVLVIMYIVNLVFAGLSMLTQNFGLRGTWLEPLIIAMLCCGALAFPVYAVTKWIKYKLENRFSL